MGRMGGRDQKKVDEDYELFLRELEEDPELRATVNLYKAGDVKMGDGVAKPAGAGKKRAQFAMDVDEAGQETETEAEDEPDFPDVKLDELLEGFDEMTLNENDVAAVVN